MTQTPIVSSPEAAATPPQGIVVSGLRRSFGDVHAVRDMTFEARPGRVTALIDAFTPRIEPWIDAAEAAAAAEAGRAPEGPPAA